MKNFVEELRWRGMLSQMMSGTEELLQKEIITAYADSWLFGRNVVENMRCRLKEYLAKP